MTTQGQEKSGEHPLVPQIESGVKEMEKGIATLVEQAAGLVDLTQKQGEAVMEALKKSVAEGAGAAELVQQEIETRLKEAIEKGRAQAQSVASLVEPLGVMFKESVVQVQKTVEETVEKNLTQLLASMKIPTRREIERVEASLEQLSQQVEQLTKAKAAAKTKKKRAATKAQKMKKTFGKARKK